MEYKIKPPDDSAFGTVRTYFTEYDPVVQEWYHGNFVPARLNDKLKALSIVNDSITVAAAHMVRSETTFNQLKENRRLLEEEVIIPAINADFDSFGDMIDQKLHRDEYGDPWTPGESISQSELFNRAKFLDQHSSLVMGWDIEDMRGTFKKSLLRDLNEERSYVRSNLRTADIDRLQTKINSVTPFSRKKILEVTSNLPRYDQSVLYDQMNANYHLTGSTFHKASINAHSRELRMLGDKFRRGLDVEIEDRSTQEIFEETYQSQRDLLDQEDAFNAHLDVIGVRNSDLRQLGIEEILELRDQRITHRYRDKLLDVLNQVNKPQSSPDYRLQELRDELREEIQNHRESEQSRIKYTKRGLQTTAYASGLGAYFVGAQELGFALQVLDPLIRRMIDRLPYLVGNDFLAFEQKFVDQLETNNDNTGWQYP